MGDWPLLSSAQSLAEAGTNTASTTGTTITASASANTKGAFAQLVASTAADAQGFILHVFGPTLVRDMLLDVAVGAAAAEQVILSNFLVTPRTSDASAHGGIWVPARIPAGSRISARLQATTGSSTVLVTVTLLAGNFKDPGGAGLVTTLGADTADSGGTAVDPGAGAANTKGAWSEVASVIPAGVSQFILALGNQLANRSTARFLLDIGVGAAAAEQVIVPNIPLHQVTGAAIMPLYFFLPVALPAGERLAVRAQSTITTATRTFDVAIYAIS